MDSSNNLFSQPSGFLRDVVTKLCGYLKKKNEDLGMRDKLLGLETTRIRICIQPEKFMCDYVRACGTATLLQARMLASIAYNIISCLLLHSQKTKGKNAWSMLVRTGSDCTWTIASIFDSRLSLSLKQTINTM